VGLAEYEPFLDRGGRIRVEGLRRNQSRIDELKTLAQSLVTRRGAPEKTNHFDNYTDEKSPVIAAICCHTYRLVSNGSPFILLLQ
jgi:hypothetical protein